jgi:hypothetical protein
MTSGLGGLSMESFLDLKLEHAVSQAKGFETASSCVAACGTEHGTLRTARAQRGPFPPRSGAIQRRALPIQDQNC